MYTHGGKKSIWDREVMQSASGHVNAEGNTGYRSTMNTQQMWAAHGHNNAKSHF